MGSCASVSVHGNSEAQMKLGLSFGSKTETLMIPPSPIKEKLKNESFRSEEIKSQRSPTTRSTTAFGDYGSKEETFFDTKAWLDSDCEDEFYSVNGDFTPSRGSTPVHFFGTPKANRSPFEKRIAGSPTPGRLPSRKKKSLLELFRDSIRENNYPDANFIANQNQNMSSGKLEASLSVNETVSKYSRTNSVSTGETPNEEAVTVKEKPEAVSMQGCLPSLVSCRSFRERKRRMSPAVAANGKV